MKTSLTKLPALVSALALLFSPAAFAKKKPVDLSPFKGNFSGGLIAVLVQTYVGSATTAINVPKSGKSAVITYGGLLSAGGMSLYLPSTITLAKNGTVTMSDIALGLGSGVLYPASGTYQSRNGNLSFSLTSSTLSLAVTAKVKDQGKKRKLNLTFILSAGGQAYTFTNTLSARAPKSPK